MAHVTCHTDGCSNSGIPIDVELTVRDADGTVRQVTTVVCGVCGQPITDIQR